MRVPMRVPTPGTGEADVAALVEAFLADPGPTSYGVLSEAVRVLPGFLVEVLPDDLARTLETSSPEDAVHELSALMPGALLSPSAHGALALALDRAGRPDEARRHRSLRHACLAAVLASGSGTRDEPWRVLRVSDEYDVLRHLGRRPRGQQLVETGATLLDRVEHDRGEVWFEVGSVPVAPS